MKVIGQEYDIVPYGMINLSVLGVHPYEKVADARQKI